MIDAWRERNESKRCCFAILKKSEFFFHFLFFLFPHYCSSSLCLRQCSSPRPVGVVSALARACMPLLAISLWAYHLSGRAHMGWSGLHSITECHLQYILEWSGSHGSIWWFRFGNLFFGPYTPHLPLWDYFWMCCPIAASKVRVSVVRVWLMARHIQMQCLR